MTELVRIHRLQRYRSLRPLNLIGNILCQILKGFFPSLTVILGIYLNSDIILNILIHYQRYKVLQGIQCKRNF